MLTDRYLLRFEAEMRQHDNAIRAKAQNELGREGVVPTEAAIRDWRDRYDAAMLKQQNQTADAGPQDLTQTQSRDQQMADVKDSGKM